MKTCPKCEQQCSEHRDVCPLCAVPLVPEPARTDKAVFASTDCVGACPWCMEQTDLRMVDCGTMHEQEQCMTCGARKPTQKIKARREVPTE